MTKPDSLTHYCIVCGRPFAATHDDSALCPDCGGTPDAGVTLADQPEFAALEGAPSLDTFATTGSQSAQPGTDAGPWRIDDVIEELYAVRHIFTSGGMGLVYRVHHRAWNLDLALKRPRPSLLQTAGQRADFVREAEAWMDLGLHPHIVTCHYVRTIDDTPCVFAEFVGGGSLQDWIRDGRLYRGGRDEVLARILDTAIQFAWGLHYAHEQQMIHQDVKPANALLTSSGTLKVTDFGLVRARSEPQVVGAKSGTRMIKGHGMTPAYCSPEQADGELLTRRTDLWSWGLSVLEMFAGKPFWVTVPGVATGQLAPQALEHYLAEGPMIADVPRMSDSVAALLAKIFQVDPRARPHDMAEVAERLGEVYQKSTGRNYLDKQPDAIALRADSLNNRALSLLDLARDDDAVAAWEEALKNDPHHPEATYNLGLWRWRRAQLTDEQLLEQLTSAMGSDEQPWLPRYLSALVHLERGDAHSAVLELEEVSRQVPDVEEIQKALAQARDAQGAGCEETFRGHTDHIWSAALGPNERYLVSASADATVRVWDLSRPEGTRCLRGHKAAVHGVAISPDGRSVVSAGEDSTLRVWDLASGACIKTLRAHTKGWAWVVAFTPDGDRIVSGGAGGDTNLEVWDVQRGRKLHTLKGHGAPIDSILTTPDCQRAVSASSTGDDISVRIWDLAKGRSIRTLEEDTGPLALTTNGRYLLTQGAGMVRMAPLPQTLKMASGALRVWALADDRCLGTLVKHRSGVAALDLEAFGYWVASAGDTRDDPLRLTNLADPERQQTFVGHPAVANALALTADGRFLLSGHSDGGLRLWLRDGGRCLRTFTGHDKGILQVFALRQSQRAVTVSRDHSLKLWALAGVDDIKAPWMLVRPRASGRLQEAAATVQQTVERARNELKRGHAAAAGIVLRKALATPGFEHDSTLLALWQAAGKRGGRKTGVLAARELYAGKVFHPFSWMDAKFVFAPNGRHVAFIGDDSTLGLWDLEEGRLANVFKGHAIGFPPADLAITSDGRQMVSVAGDRTARVWDLATGRCLQVVQGHQHYISAVALTKDDRYALSGGWDGPIRFWRLRDGRMVRVLEGHRAIVRRIEMSEDGRTAVSGSNDGTLRVWDLATGNCRHTLEGHTRVVFDHRLTRDGRYVVSGDGGGTVRVWDIVRGTCLHTLQEHKKSVNRIVLTPDDRWALSASQDGSLILWDIQRGKDLRRLSGHEGDVVGLALTPDGRFAVSGAEDQTVRIWDLTSGRCLQTLQGHTSSVIATAVAADARFIISGGKDVMLRQWVVDWDYEFPAGASSG